MQQGKAELTAALTLLGEILDHRAQRFDVVFIGGGALLLQDLIARSTLDLDAVALVRDGVWSTASPLPSELVRAVRDVAEALDLSRQPRDAKDWLNEGPTILLKLGLPPGFEGRATAMQFGGLTVRVASRVDLIFLKLWAATDLRRGARRAVDIDDLHDISPTVQEIRDAISWCVQKDGRPDFGRAVAAEVVTRLGFAVDELINE